MVTVLPQLLFTDKNMTNDDYALVSVIIITITPLLWLGIKWLAKLDLHTDREE